LGILLKEVGELYGLNVSTCFTDMNQPLGKTASNQAVISSSEITPEV